MPNASFSVLARNSTLIETDLDGWTKVECNPTVKTWIEYSSDDGAVIAGWWDATPGTCRATYEAWEFVHLMERRIVITPDAGEPGTVGPGDAFVVDKGFAGTWKIEEKVRKHFVIRSG